MTAGAGRIVITGGGTAGHTNPGIAVAEALVAKGVAPEQIHFVGGRRGNEATLVADAGFSIDLLPGRGIPRRIGLDAAKAGIELVAGLFAGFWLVLRRRPRAVLCLGGYAALAVSLAAVVLRVPLVVTEQNARASAVNRLVGRFARACALPFPQTDLPNGVVTGNPSLEAVVHSVAEADRVSGRQALDLPLDRRVVAVWSGSLGATRVNEAVRGLAERWADRDDLAIRHVIGRRDWSRFREPPAVVRDGALVYQLVEYENQMPHLLVAADAAVCRAGASTVAELTIAGLPAVLVPLPSAPRDHQRANTEEVVDAGGAVLLADGDLTVDTLADALGAMLEEPSRLAEMAKASASVARPGAAGAVAELVLDAAAIPLSAEPGGSAEPINGEVAGPDGGGPDVD